MTLIQLSEAFELCKTVLLFEKFIFVVLYLFRRWEVTLW